MPVHIIEVNSDDMGDRQKIRPRDLRMIAEYEATNYEEVRGLALTNGDNTLIYVWRDSDSKIIHNDFCWELDVDPGEPLRFAALLNGALEIENLEYWELGEDSYECRMPVTDPRAIKVRKMFQQAGFRFRKKK